MQCACDQRHKQPGNPHDDAPTITTAKKPVVKVNQLPPEVIPIKKAPAKVAGKPKIVTLKSNVHFLKTPKSIRAGKPLICIPGTDTFTLPKVVGTTGRRIVSGLPQIIDAKEPFINDKNPFGISSFKVFQGLKINNVITMIEDRAGNLWISAWEGGVSKYDGRSFTHYTTSQGLSHNNVFSMLEDSKGNIWIGTIGGGVNKYDGRSFTHYTTVEGISDDNVESILQDSKGNLWFGTVNGGVNRFDGKSFEHFTTAQGLINNHVRSILEDSIGNLWFGTSGGLSKYDGKSFSNYTTDQGLHNNDIWYITEDKNRNIWISPQENGIDKYDGKSFTHYSSKEGLSSNNVWKILEDKEGNLWFCTMDKGVNKFDGKSFTYFDVDQGLSNNTVHCILADRSGNIWMGTDGGGVNKYDGGSFSHIHHTQGLITGNISCTMEDKHGNIWVGSLGGGLNKYNGNTIEQYTDSQGLSNNRMNCMMEDSHGNIWIGTWGSGVDKYDGKSFTNYSAAEGLTSDGVVCMLEDKKGNIWLGTSEGLTKYDGISFTRFDTSQGLSHMFITSIAEDKAGNIWLGTYGGGVNIYNGKSFSAYTSDQGLSSDDVLSIFKDSHGNIWIGTYHEGINKFDGESFTHYTTSQGLSNNRIGSIREDNDGNMWFLTNNGLCKMRYNNKENSRNINLDNSQIPLFKNYLFSDGFFGVGNDYNTLTVDRNGRIWAGAGDRLSCYHSEKDIPDTIPPNIQVKSILLFNENINWPHLEKNKDTVLLLSNGVKLQNFAFSGLSKWYYLPENLKLPYDNNYLTFQFVGITTKKTQHIKYQYFLDGLDKDWNLITEKPEATYKNLPPGSYIFKVKAVNSEGHWSNEFAYRFTILPPWWKTLWFRILAVLFLFGIFYGLVRWGLNQKFRRQLEQFQKEKQLAEFKQKTTELEMQALRAQMNPHFIFNSLNSITVFIMENDKAKAAQYLTKFSRLVRLILQNSLSPLISLENELEALRLYLELEALRFNHHFEYTLDAAEDLNISILKVPPLIIQPYVENAIWHGLMQKEEKGKLQIKLFRHENVLCCRIIDDGIGRKRAAELKSKSAATHKSLGMRITADRIEMLQHNNPVQAFINITDIILPDGTAAGTEVLLKIPLLYD
jgi:ligand-binding sensor domain-containing protein